MADNVAIPSTGATIAADDISDVFYQRVKLVLGADGVNAGDISGANPVPVQTTGTSIVSVSGTPITALSTRANLIRGTTSTTNTADTTIITAGGSPTYSYITQITIHNTSVTDTYVTIKDGTTAILVVPAPAKGGAALTFPAPLVCADNAVLAVACAASVSTIFASASGFRLAS